MHPCVEVRGHFFGIGKRISRELHVPRNAVRNILRSDEMAFGYERARQPKSRINP